MTFDLAALQELVGKLRSDDPPEIDNPDMPLEDYGLDSLDLSGIFLELERRYSLVIEDEDMERLTTARRIIDFVAARAVAA